MKSHVLTSSVLHVERHWYLTWHLTYLTYSRCWKKHDLEASLPCWGCDHIAMQIDTFESLEIPEMVGGFVEGIDTKSGLEVIRRPAYTPEKWTAGTSKWRWKMMCSFSWGDFSGSKSWFSVGVNHQRTSQVEKGNPTEMFQHEFVKKHFANQNFPPKKIQTSLKPAPKPETAPENWSKLPPKDKGCQFPNHPFFSQN